MQICGGGFSTRGCVAHCLGKAATHTQLKHVLVLDIATSQIRAEQLSMLYAELHAIISREGLDMFRQLLARLIPRRRPFRVTAIRAAEVGTHEPLCVTGLHEVYLAHAAIHGPNQLLPVDALPHPSERSCASEASGRAEHT
jgi:hypothetical protein